MSYLLARSIVNSIINFYRPLSLTCMQEEP